MHGKPSVINRHVDNSGSSSSSSSSGSGVNNSDSCKGLKYNNDVLSSLPPSFTVARYHSLYGDASSLPSDLQVLATTDDGIIMGVQHSNLPIAAVQFHPESILTAPQHGLQILENALHTLKSSHYD